MPKFLHAADLHIDSPLRGLDAIADAPSHELRNATRAALRNLVQLALDEQVAFVVLAGDVYDRDPLLRTALFFREQMQRLAQAGIPVVIGLGNHDHAGISPRSVKLPDNVQVLSHDRPESIAVVAGVVLHGQSYARFDVTEDLTAHYPAAVPGHLNIGILHTALAGDPEHPKYASTTPQTLAALGYQYWALGHVHRHARHDVGGVPIVFPGNLQGRHAKETGPKGAVICQYDATRILSVDHHALDVMRWHHVEVSVDGASSEGALWQRVRDDVLASTASDREGRRLCAVRVTLVGVLSSALSALQESALRDYLAGEFQATSGTLWLEKIKITARCESESRTEVESQLRSLARELVESGEARSQLGLLLGEIRAELRRIDPRLNESNELLGVDVAKLDELPDAAIETLLERALALVVHHSR